MTKLLQLRWLIGAATAVLLAGCVFPPPPSAAVPPASAPPLPVQASSSTPVLVPTDTPPAVSATTTSVTPAQQQLLAGLPALGAAPELQNEIWFNSAPLQLAALRGKVVMVEFWTYG